MPKQVDHALRRRQLVEASWDVIAAEGIEGVTLRKVAKAADCTTGRIAHYFSGREELVLSALRAAHKDAARRMMRIARSDADAQDRLRRVVFEGLPLDAARLREWKVWLVFAPYLTVYCPPAISTVTRMVPPGSPSSGSAIRSRATFPPWPPFVYRLVWNTAGGPDNVSYRSSTTCFGCW